MAGLQSSPAVCTLLTAGLLVSLAGAAEPPLPQEPGKKHAASAMQPLDVLADCIRAVESGDYRRYVGHLTEQEQQTQAGYALFVTQIMGYMGNIVNDEDAAQSLLLARGLQDVADKHVVPKNQFSSDTHRNAEKAMSKLRSMAFMPNMPNPYAGPYSGQLSPNANQLLTLFADTAGRISDVPAYLAAAVQEAALPTITQVSSGAGEDARSASAKSGEPLDLLGDIKKMKWTLHVRGNNAIAISKRAIALPVAPRSAAVGQPQSYTQPQPVPAYGTPVLQAPAAQAPAAQAPAPQAVRSTKTYRVEFKRRDGTWKISRLLPNDIVSAVTPVLASVCTPRVVQSGTQPASQPANYPYYTPSRSAQPATYSTPSATPTARPPLSQTPRREPGPPAAGQR